MELGYRPLWARLPQDYLGFRPVLFKGRGHLGDTGFKLAAPTMFLDDFPAICPIAGFRLFNSTGKPIKYRIHGRFRELGMAPNR
jgi:hypothetical protein